MLAVKNLYNLFQITYSEHTIAHPVRLYAWDFMEIRDQPNVSRLLM